MLPGGEAAPQDGGFILCICPRWSKGRPGQEFFSSKQVLEISSNLEDGRLPQAGSHPHAVIHYPRTLHRRQLALEGNELMNMHRLVLINYASHSPRPRRRAEWFSARGDRRLAHKDFL